MDVSRLHKMYRIALPDQEPFFLDGFEDGIGDFLHYSAQLLERHPAPKVMVDIGAHIGTTSILAAWNGADIVFAYEPSPLVYSKLVTNIIMNGLWGKVIPTPLAVIAVKSKNTLPMWSPRHGSSGQGSMALKFNDHIETSVKTISLGEVVDYVYARYGQIDLLKIDTEGAEWHILKDLGPLELVDRLDIELHAVDNLKLASDDLEKRLRASGFEVEGVDPFDTDWGKLPHRFVCSRV